MKLFNNSTSFIIAYKFTYTTSMPAIFSCQWYLPDSLPLATVIPMSARGILLHLYHQQKLSIYLLVVFFALSTSSAFHIYYRQWYIYNFLPLARCTSPPASGIAHILYLQQSIFDFMLVVNHAHQPRFILFYLKIPVSTYSSYYQIIINSSFYRYYSAKYFPTIANLLRTPKITIV